MAAPAGSVRVVSLSFASPVDIELKRFHNHMELHLRFIDVRFSIRRRWSATEWGAFSFRSLIDTQ